MKTSTWEETTAQLARRLTAAFGRIDGFLQTSAAVLARTPGPSEWSALQTAEHVALANHYLLLLLEKIAQRARGRAARGKTPPAEVSRLDQLEHLSQRSFRWESPEHMLPSGCATAREIAKSLEEQRRRCVALLAEMRRGEGALHSISMSVVGEKLDLYQYLALVVLHMERHAEQMERAVR